MDHPDFNAAWLDEDLDGYARGAFTGKATGEHLKRIVNRNRYILDCYLAAAQDVGLARALQETAKRLEPVGHSYSMVAEATKGWRDDHGRPRSEGVYSARTEERIALLESTVATMQAWIGRRNAEGLPARVQSLEAFRNHSHSEAAAPIEAVREKEGY